MPNNALNNCDFEFVKYSEEWIVGTPECFIIVQATPPPPNNHKEKLQNLKPSSLQIISCFPYIQLYNRNNFIVMKFKLVSFKHLLRGSGPGSTWRPSMDLMSIGPWPAL